MTGLKNHIGDPERQAEPPLCSAQGGLLPTFMLTLRGISIKLEIELLMKEKFLVSARPCNII